MVPPASALLAVAALLALPASSDPQAQRALQAARQRTLATPYIEVLQTGQATRVYSPVLSGRRRGKRVLLWATGREELTWQPSRRCYRRSTDFNRQDVRDERAALVPADLQDVHLALRGRDIVYRGHTPPPGDT